MKFNQHFVLRKRECADLLLVHALDRFLRRYGVRNCGWKGAGRGLEGGWRTVERYRLSTDCSFPWRFSCFEVQRSARIWTKVKG